jgi:hypothetical protein
MCEFCNYFLKLYKAFQVKSIDICVDKSDYKKNYQHETINALYNDGMYAIIVRYNIIESRQ